MLQFDRLKICSSVERSPRTSESRGSESRTIAQRWVSEFSSPHFSLVPGVSPEEKGELKDEDIYLE